MENNIIYMCVYKIWFIIVFLLMFYTLTYYSQYYSHTSILNNVFYLSNNEKNIKDFNDKIRSLHWNYCKL